MAWFKPDPIIDNIGKEHYVRGLYFGPLTTNLIARPLLSLTVGVLSATVLWAVVWSLAWIFEFKSPVDRQIAGYLALALSLLFVLPEEEQDNVPEAHAAMVTFLSSRTRLYRTEGRYTWTGRHLGFGRSKKVAEPGTDSNGFIYIGEIQIPIWNSAQERDQITLSNVAKDSSTIYANLLTVIRLADPYLWTSSRDPLTDIAERARAAFRTAISFFNGTDNALVKSVLGKLMSGYTMVTVFLRKNTKSLDKGAVLQDMGGRHVYDIVEPKAIDEEHEKEAFRGMVEGLSGQINPDALSAVKDSNGQIVVETRTIQDTLNEVVDAVGAVLLRASVADITLSDEVAREANKAASEAFQRRAQLASAETTKLARRVLTPSKKEAVSPHFELATLLAAAQDNPNVKVVMVPGGDSLTRAAVAGGSQIGGSNK